MIKRPAKRHIHRRLSGHFGNGRAVGYVRQLRPAQSTDQIPVTHIGKMRRFFSITPVLVNLTVIVENRHPPAARGPPDGG